MRAMKKLPVILLFALTSLTTFAQSSYPIYVYPVLMPPYSLRLSDYSQPGSQRLVITVQVRDVMVTNLPVRLHIRMETFDGRGIETVPNITVLPTYLGGGETSILFGEDLEPYFNIDNLVFKGYSKEQYRRTGQLPEGFYRVTVEVRHYATGRLISNQGTAMAWFALGKPPMLKLPSNGAELGQIPGMPLNFTWQPNNTGTPTGNIQYTFELWEMRIPGINPNVIAASMPSIYRTTQFHNTLTVQPAELMMEPGMQYAWRVTASDAMGQVPFEQDGKSEMRTFIYQCKCDEVTNLRVERKNKDAVYKWDVNPAIHTSFNVEAEDTKSGYKKSERIYTNQYTLKNLDYETKYRLRVQAICKGDEMNPSEFTDWKEFVLPTPPSREEICPDCSCDIPEQPAYKLTNFTLRNDLQPGDTIVNNYSRFIIVSAKPAGNNTYEGQFLFWWEFYGVKFLANYWNLQVNTDNQVVNFGWKTVKDSTLLVDVDAVANTVNDVADAIANLSTNMTIKDTVQISASLEGAYVDQNGELVTVTQNTDGNLIETVQPLPHKPDGMLVQGDNGEEYVLTSDGKIMGKEEFTSTGGNSRLMENYKKEKEASAQPSVTFLASPSQQYGFDTYSEIQHNIEFEYPELKIGYRPAFKSVAPYQTDKVLTDGGTDIIYRTEFGVAISRSGNELIIRGEKDGSEIALYAYQKQDTTDVMVGKLNVLTLAKQTRNVCIISVNGATLPDKTILENALNRIYIPAITQWNVTIADPLQNITFANENMTHGGSGALSMYNADQKTVIKAFEGKQKPDKETVYLFFVENVQGKESDADGYMPLQYQYGFIYGYKDAIGVAHELGHGAFNLSHTFGSPFIAEQGQTNNLMDYSRKTELWKHQWKLIHDPKNLIFKFWQEEKSGELYTINEVKTLIDTIRSANAKTLATVPTIVRYQDIIDEINIDSLANVTPNLSKEEFLSAYSHDETLKLIEDLRNREIDTLSYLPSDYNPILLTNKVDVSIGNKTYKLTINGYAMTSKIYTTHIAEDIINNEHKLIFFNAIKVEKNDKPNYITKTDKADLKNIRKAFEIIVHTENNYGTAEDLKKYLKVKGTFDLSGNPTVSNDGITIRLKRKYSNSKITIGELTIDGDESVKLVTVELKKGTKEQSQSNCDSNIKDSTCFRLYQGTYPFELNTISETTKPQHRYKSLRLQTLNVSNGGKRNGILVHTGWNYGFTEGCILVMNYNDVQKVIDNPQNYLNRDSTGVKNVNLDNSAPTTMSLYEYVEKNVPNATIKGKIIITDEDNTETSIQNDSNDKTNKQEQKQEKKTFLQNVLDVMSIMISNLIIQI
jgi:hypothetical protein